MNDKISEIISDMHVIDAHEHTRPRESLIEKGPSIFDVLEGSYVFWASKASRADSYDGLVGHLKEITGSAFYKACCMAVEEIHGVDIDPPTAEALSAASERVREAYEDRDWIGKVFKEKALIDRALLDPYWDVWGGSFAPDLFSPVFRINMLLFGYDREAKDHNGNTPYGLERHLGLRVETFEEYEELVDKAIEAAKRRGYVALKSALAYDRPILFEEVDAGEAKRVFGKKSSELSPVEIRSFGDYFFHRIMRKAGEMDLPVQIHTGLAIIEGSNPMNLVGILRKYPDVDFILFHGGYPWMGEATALAFSFPNVHLDLCWLPIISPSACGLMLREAIELGLSSRIMWGGDCWMAESTYGALRAFKDILSEVLGKMVSDDYLKRDEALDIASRVLRGNAARIFGIT